MISEEFIQGVLLSFLSWYHSESDVYKVACRLTKMMYPEYAEMVCLDSIPNEEIQREILTPVYYPDAAPPFAGVLLVSGSSPATSNSMMERKEYFLKRGFAVMILNSFTRARILEDCFRKDAPCKTYQQLPGSHWNSTMPLPSDCPVVTEQSIEQLMFKSYLNRITVGGTLSPAERTHDLFEALHIFRQDEKVDPYNLAVIGYSHGGSTVLEALTLTEEQIPPPGDEVYSFEEHSLKGIRAAVVYYPNCRPGTYFHWHAATKKIPVQMHLADLDEYVKPELCRSVIDKINNARWFSKIQRYDYDEKHAFDMKEYGDAYSEKSKNQAYQRSLEFIRASLSQEYQYECIVD